MALTLNPNTPQVVVTGQPLCFEGSGIVIIPQEDTRYIDLPASGTNWTYNSSVGLYKKVGGESGTPTGFNDAIAISTDIASSKQPFRITGANSTFSVDSHRNSHVYFGVIDDQNRVYACQVMKYCNGNGSCGALGGSDWMFTAQTQYGFPYSRTVDFNELFHLRSDGITLYYERSVGTPNNVETLYYITLPESTSWRFFASAGFLQNEISYLQTFKGTYQGPVPIVWSAPLGGALSGTANNQCFLANDPGDYSVCIDSEFDEPLCVSIHASSLTFTPEDFDCGGCVFTNQIIKFTSNGALTGILTVKDDLGNPVGTVIDALTWQAPGHPVHVTARYTLAADYVECTLNVVPRLKVINIEGDTIVGMAPGETLKLETNYEYMGGTVRWENLDCPNLVTPDGYLTIPRNYRNHCFGAVDCYIRVRAVLFPGGVVCSNFDPDLGGAELTLDFRVIVDPIFPTPEFDGPNWIKWKPETPDFRVVTKTMEGGCAETYIRNRVPIQRWTVNYNALKYTDTHICEIPSCCDDPLGFINGVDPDSQTAKMLDDFWMLVGGESGFFTLVDPKTGYIWRRVRFEDKMQRDHINWRRTQSRTFTLIWNPCCATEPAGGMCPHNTVRDDPFPPSIPTDIQVTPVSWSELKVSWTASVDNVGIKRYEVSRDSEEPIQLDGTSTSFTDRGLTPTTTHFYKVRAVDLSNNPSEWSLQASGTTFDHNTEAPSIPMNLTVITTDTGQLQVYWSASTDDVEVAGYSLIVDGLVIDVGLTTAYDHTGLDECTLHEYYVRAYDGSGNKSPWSRSAVGITTCPQLLEGVDGVEDGADSVIEG